MPKQKPSLAIASLNVGRMLQGRTWDYVKGLNDPNAEIPDVLCVQDIPFDIVGQFQRLPHVAFAPMTNHLINGVRGVVGIAFFSRYFMTDIAHHTVWGDGMLKNLEGINEQNQRHLGAESDTLVEATEDRVVICAKVVKDGEEFEVATTHGMWVRNGVTNDVQRVSTEHTIAYLTKRAHFRDGLVLIGDMNFGRGGEIYKMFTESKFRDCMPAEIDNTLDPEHAFVKKGGKVVTDYVMTLEDFPDDFLPHRPPLVSNVRLRSGVSDHCLLSATVTKKE